MTGGGTGVGRAIALALAAERPVAVLGRRAAPLEETAAEISGRGGRALAVPVDVTDDGALALMGASRFESGIRCGRASIHSEEPLTDGSRQKPTTACGV